MVGQSIERWKIKKENPFHGSGRCHICGDSATNKSKTRFHIIQHDDTIFVKCFNCDYSTNLIGYMKTYHPAVFQEFLFERYRVNGNQNVPVITCKPVIKTESIKTTPDRLFTLDLPLVSDLPPEHPVRLYVASRKLPDAKFQYTENFYEFASEFNPDMIKPYKDEPRLIIPFFDKNGSVFAFQGRDLSGKSDVKYITIRINKKIPNIYGLDKIDLKSPIIIVEGPLDSLFLKNCLASVNASLVSTAEKLKSVVEKKNITLVYDCEPRNKVICSMYAAAIKKGYNIVIWPDSQTEKDINDLVLAKKSPQEIINKNTYNGLMALLMFDRWKRC